MAASTTSRLTGVERRASILQAALHLFAKRGFRGTTTRDLAAAVGVTEPVLYEHFPSKRAIYEQLIEQRMQEKCGIAMTLLTPFCEKGDDRGYFETLANFILEQYVSEPEYTRLFLHIGLEGGELANEYYERQILTAQRLVAERIRDRVEKKVFRKMDPMVAARTFLSTVVNQGLLLVLFRDNFSNLDRKEYVRQTVDIFLNGVLKQPIRPQDQSHPQNI